MSRVDLTRADRRLLTLRNVTTEYFDSSILTKILIS